jgi:aspartate carbamoyltransferase catalytic subunit
MTTRTADRAGLSERFSGRVAPERAAAALKSRHLLGIAGLGADEITLVLDTAEAMKEIGGRAIKKVPTLRGRTVVNLFFEPSTRTLTSF